MADTKISALTALTGANVDTAADVLAIVDTSATATKKILVDELRNAIGPVLATEQATTSGTTKDFTIPSWAKRVTVTVNGLSLPNTEDLIVQLGDSGGIETSGYVGSVVDLMVVGTGVILPTTGFYLTGGSATGNHVLYGQAILTLEDASDFTWIYSSTIAYTSGASQGMSIGAGAKATSAAMTTVRVTTSAGGAFDAGAVNVLYE